MGRLEIQSMERNKSIVNGNGFYKFINTCAVKRGEDLLSSAVVLISDHVGVIDLVTSVSCISMTFTYFRNLVYYMLSPLSIVVYFLQVKKVIRFFMFNFISVLL